MKRLFFLHCILISGLLAQTNPKDSLDGSSMPVYFTDRELPNILFVPLSGTPFKLKDLKGQIVVLNWWFTTCSPCQEEIPELNELVRKYKGTTIRFISIARNKKSDLKKYLKEHAFHYEQTIVTDRIHRIFNDNFPRNIIINNNGVVVFDRIGYSPFNAGTMNEKLEELLKAQ